jgi:hypothetical protein
MPVAAADEQGEADADGNYGGRRHHDWGGLGHDDSRRRYYGARYDVRRSDNDRGWRDAHPNSHGADANADASADNDLSVGR